MNAMPMEATRGRLIAWSWSYSSYEAASGGFWKPNLSPLEEQCFLLPAEPSPVPMLLFS